MESAEFRVRLVPLPSFSVIKFYHTQGKGDSDMDTDMNALSESAFAWLGTVVPKVAGVLVLLIVSWIVAGWAARVLRKGLGKASFDKTLTHFFANFVRYAIITMAVMASLGVFGIATTSFVALIGAAGLAVGLAFQGTLGNFAAGVMLLIFRPFKVDDVVSVAGVTGKVVLIELFTTQFDTPDNRRIIVPNGTIFGNTIENVIFHDKRGVDVSVGTDYNAGLDNTKIILERATKAVSGIMDDPAPQVVLTDLGDSTINWQIRVWCPAAAYFAVKEALTHDVKLALDAANISIPYPQMDLHLDGILERANGATA